MKSTTLAVCHVYGITEAQIKGPQRWQPLATARQIAMVLAMDAQPLASMEQVARYFRRHRTTLIYARKAVHNFEQFDPKTAKVIHALRKKFSRTLDQVLEEV